MMVNMRLRLRGIKFPTSWTMLKKSKDLPVIFLMMLIVVSIICLILSCIYYMFFVDAWNIRHLVTEEKQQDWKGRPYRKPFFEVMPSSLRCRTTMFITYVYSDFSHVDKREELRTALSKSIEASISGLSLIFVIGKPTKEHSNDVIKKVKKEIRAYRDILQVTSLDTEENLSHKGICAMHWILTNCPAVTLVAKIEEAYDYYFERELYLTRIHAMKLLQYFTGMVICGKIKEHVPVSDFNYIDEDSLINHKEEYFPMYCDSSRGTYMTTDTVRTILETAKTTDTFAIDNVYISGLLRLKGNLGIAEIILG